MTRYTYGLYQDGYTILKDGEVMSIEDILFELNNSVPNERGKNRYGLDVDYFRKTINRELNKPLINFRPDELARVFARLSMAADPSVLLEKEFTGIGCSGNLSIGVGDGSGNLFVHGDYDSVKAVQNMIFELEELRKSTKSSGDNK